MQDEFGARDWRDFQIDAKDVTAAGQKQNMLSAGPNRETK